MIRIGLIADTHGLLRPQACDYLRGCDFIVHAGDICDAQILDQLALIAPVTAVRGNNDIGPWADRLPDTARLLAGGVCVHVIHDLSQLDLEPSAAGVQVVVSGHSHKPQVAQRGGVLFVNPGSAGPRRFRLPISIGQLTVAGGLASATTFEIA